MAPESFYRELCAILEETFETHHGIYLDKDTSLFVTLAQISAKEASIPVGNRCATIAAQVEHIRYYLNVLSSNIQNRKIEKVDWDKSWSAKKVTAEEWTNLQNQLMKEYRQFVSDLEKVNQWKGEDDIGASFAILSHSAYHLGAIRQLIHFLSK